MQLGSDAHIIYLRPTAATTHHIINKLTATALS